jgi:hypothetical protein
LARPQARSAGGRPPAGPERRQTKPLSPEQIARYSALVEELRRQRPERSYRTDIPPERRARWRIKARERYQNNLEVREAAARRYRQRWDNEPAFREAHRRRARERYYRLKLEQAAKQELDE